MSARVVSETTEKKFDIMQTTIRISATAETALDCAREQLPALSPSDTYGDVILELALDHDDVEVSKS